MAKEPHAEVVLLTNRFDRALDYAVNHHRTQLRKGTAIPYVAHLLAVAALALEMGCDEDEAIAALLHDVVEDRGGRSALREIEREFGERVARIVLASSDSDHEPKPPWLGRKQAYLASLAHKQPDELRVALADKLHNARAMLLDYREHGDSLWARFRAGEGESIKWYYRSLVAGFEARRTDIGAGAQAALGELHRVVDELDLLARNQSVASTRQSQ